ncbi:hypothetical protein [Alkalicoccobacillus plakortidis]
MTVDGIAGANTWERLLR